MTEEHGQRRPTEDVAAGAEAEQARVASPAEQRPVPSPGPAPDGDRGAWSDLLGDTKELTDRWEAIQRGFVDEPRRAVEDADALVGQVIERLNQSFSTQRSRLEARWSEGEQASTEELRVALRQYRSFFDRLLSR